MVYRKAVNVKGRLEDQTWLALSLLFFLETFDSLSNLIVKQVIFLLVSSKIIVLLICWLNVFQLRQCLINRPNSLPPKSEVLFYLDIFIYMHFVIFDILFSSLKCCLRILSEYYKKFKNRYLCIENWYCVSSNLQRIVIIWLNNLCHVVTRLLL